MEKYPPTEYRKRLREVRRREGWKLAEPVLVRGILGVVALALVGLGLGVAQSQPILGVVVGVALSLGYVWLEVRHSAGLYVWREDQEALAVLAKKANGTHHLAETVADLTIKELQGLPCPFGDTSRTAADFVVECFDLMKRGQGYEDKIAAQFSGSAGVPLGDKRNPIRQSWWAFLARIRHLNVIEKAALEPRFFLKEPLGQEVYLRLVSSRSSG